MKKRALVNKKDLTVYLIPLRYVFLLILFLVLYNVFDPENALIYKMFTPITIGSFTFLLKLFFTKIDILNDLVIINYSTIIRIVPACVAGSAYLLLIILNLTVNMSLYKRIFSLILSILSLFIINILRLLFFTFLLVSGSNLFDFTHKLFWYLLSTIFVIGIWFLTIRFFSIKETPIYDDIKILLKYINKKSK